MAVVPLVALAACSSVPNAATHNGAVPTAAQIGASVHNNPPTATESVPNVQIGAPPSTATPGLKVQDRSHDNDNPDNTLYALYQIANSGTKAVPLTSVTMRYCFTNEAPADPLVFECDWAQVGCSNISARFVALSSPTSQANTYLEISFKAGASGSLADPSFVYKDTQTVTLYQAGTLVWGTEPKA